MLELLYFKVANHFNIIDKPNLRSSHSYITLRGGGIIFFFGIWLWAAIWGFKYPWFIIGLTLISLVSFIDDVHSVPNWVRLFVQFSSMLLLLIQIGIVQWNMWWIVIVALIVGVGIINAYNFMDGINGITGGYSLSVLVPLVIVNSYHQSQSIKYIDQRLLIVIIISVIVFCFFNFRKRAKCFAGDVGAVSIAYVLLFAIGSLMFVTRDLTYIMFLAVYGVDTVLTIIHRILLREHLGQAHRKHAYQLMVNELKIPHIIVSSIYMGIQLLISLGLIFIPMNHYIYSFIILTLLSVAYILFMKKYYHLHEEYLIAHQNG